MTPYDGVMIALIAAGMIWGAIRGITWQLASLASLVLGYLFAHPVSAAIAPYLPGEAAVQRGLGMILAYVVVSGGVFVVAWSVRAMLHKMKFEAFDRHLGMLLGGVEGAFRGLVGTLFVTTFAASTREPIYSSSSGKVVARVMDTAGPLLPDEIRKVVVPFWTHLQEESETAAIAGNSPTPAESSSSRADSNDSIDGYIRQGKAKFGQAVGDAVKSEFERMGENGDPKLKRE